MLYDKYTIKLINKLNKNQLNGLLTVAANKMQNYLNSKISQIQSIADLPSIINFLESKNIKILQNSTIDIISYEIDKSDTFGLIIFDEKDNIIISFPGQIASGPPYFGSSNLDLTNLYITKFKNDIEIVGPYPPNKGYSGWFLIRKIIKKNNTILGSVALHLRLASLTEIIGNLSTSKYYRFILLTPDNIYSSIGIPISERYLPDIITGYPIIPGWYSGVIKINLSSSNFGIIREYLLVLYIISIIIIIFIFHRLSQRMKQDIFPLIKAAKKIANGDLNYKINIKGENEISSLAQELEKMRKQLKYFIDNKIYNERKMLMGQLSINIAHELKNPLATIKTSIQSLLFRESDFQKKELYIMIVEEIDRINIIINELLLFSNSKKPKITIFVLKNLINKIEVLFKSTFSNNNIKFIKKGNFEIKIKADKNHIFQILYNLIINSIEAMPNGGLLVISCKAANNEAKIEIRDTGSGIPKKYLDLITTPFFTTKKNGQGLGLSIALELTKINNGKLEFISTLGKGTTAILTLPLK
ncbi:sensor histidine kinase [Deferribacter autotrophicus]|nr:ATP-binding protein [Deferribacter autotrophicus]